MERYESIVSNQAAELDRMIHRRTKDGESLGTADGLHKVTFTHKDIEREEQEVRDLEAKKTSLEDRVSSIERDLGGLLR